MNIKHIRTALALFLLVAAMTIASVTPASASVIKRYEPCNRPACMGSGGGPIIK